MADFHADEGKKDCEEFIGSIDRVVFHNDDNDWTVFRMNAEGREDPITVVGSIHAPQPGTRLRISGRWVNHQRFGRQLQMESWNEELPASAEGMRLFLASGYIKGIGEKWADKIVAYFGEETLDVLDNSPERMLEIRGFGEKRLAAMKASWDEHRNIRQLMVFLQPHGVTPGMAARIYRHYGNDALSIVRENPYRLAMDIRGIGFLTADALAQKLGFGTQDPLRAQAGMLYILMELADEGHVYYPREQLLDKAQEKLQVPREVVENALEDLAAEERIVEEELDDHVGVYLSQSHHYESTIGFYMHRLIRSPRAVSFFRSKKQILGEVLSNLPIRLADEQLHAVKTAMEAKMMVLTGGPGTGKTTVINAIIRVYKAMNARILLAAPTGRAAKRLSEASGAEAKTIHRLLEFSPAENEFKKNENSPLACSLLVVDEASMIDNMLMYHLVKAIPLGATFILVGDINQLPSVGPGNVLRDIIASGAVPVVELVEVFRQAAESDIICNAHRINSGELPQVKRAGQKTDFFIFRQDDPEEAAKLIVDLVSRRIPQKFGFPAADIQVLSPMLRGAVGVNSLNRKLQETINPSREALVRGDRTYKLNDRVMQIKNNYDKDVFNGDIGTVVFLDAENRELSVRFDDKSVSYPWEDLDELVPAYAISIHKSQGGEYPVVVIPIMIQHYMLLQRNLVYTAVTRGKKMVVLVGEWRALAMAVKNNHIRQRYTWLAHRIASDDGQIMRSMLPEIPEEGKK